ncbi:uncharacterized protein METZ01_LOCUS275931, partial [marine metagenome]
MVLIGTTHINTKQKTPLKSRVFVLKLEKGLFQKNHLPGLCELT